MTAAPFLQINMATKLSAPTKSAP